MAANRIVKEHQELRTNVGTWDVEGSFWMAPGAPPVQSNGVSDIRTILRGRFIQENYKTEFMGRPFEGIGIVGYDTVRRKYVSIWMDTMTNLIMQQVGTADDSGQTVTYRGEHPKPGGNGSVKTQMIYEVAGPDRRELVAYEVERDGSKRKTTALIYKRTESGKKDK